MGQPRSRLLITGTGRSGTGWCAALLNTVGVKCGHEQVWTVEAAKSGDPDWDGWDAEASWHAVPHLWPEWRDGHHTVLVVRHPLDTVRSFMELEPGGGIEAWRNVAEPYCPAAFAEPDEWDRALAFWCAWNGMAERHADETVRLETIGPHTIVRWAALTGHDIDLGAATRAVAAVGQVNTKKQHKTRVWPHRWSAHRAGLVATAQAQAARYGYAP